MYDCMDKHLDENVKSHITILCKCKWFYYCWVECKSFYDCDSIISKNQSGLKDSSTDQQLLGEMCLETDESQYVILHSK